MKNPPLVSCVINFFNAEKFFQEAIESILAQTYNNGELLLVDDGSTDGSTAIAQKYAQNYPDKIFYLEHEHHQNKGTSAARNLGMKKAQGKYIAFLHANLETMGLTRPIFFAYPYGDYNQKVQEVTQKIGLEVSFTVEPDLVKPGDNLYEIPRIETRRDADLMFLLRKVFFAN
jgi:glycosyltransferase involved in cell wall biosynthesis